MPKNKYNLVVGNIGNIDYSNKRLAIIDFNEYKDQSIKNYGRAGGEDVILFEGDNILMEYYGTINSEDNND